MSASGVEEYLRFLHRGQPAWGRLQGGRARLLSAAPWAQPAETGEELPATGLELLPPAEARTVVCVGLNYRDHAAEMGHAPPAEPVLFLKPVTALLGAGRPIRLPARSQRVDYEAELAFVLGKPAGPQGVPPGAIFGWTCANDVTARDLQKLDGQWTRAKGFDGFCPLGPSLRRGLDLADAAIRCRVNGELKQDSRTGQLVFGPEALLGFIAGIMSLQPGDVVLTGTPGGIGPLQAGDSVEVSVEGLAPLINPVAA